MIEAFVFWFGPMGLWFAWVMWGVRKRIHEDTERFLQVSAEEHQLAMRRIQRDHQQKLKAIRDQARGGM